MTFKNFEVRIVAFLGLLLLLLAYSCTKDQYIDMDTSTTQEYPDQNVTKYENALQKLGFSTNNLIVSDNFVIVDNDILFTKKNLKLLIDDSKAIISSTAVSEANIRDIAVFIAPGFTNIQIGLVRDAMQKWENIPDSSINFREVGTNAAADLTIAPDDFANLPGAMRNLNQGATGCGGVHGIAWFANNGDVGRWVSINEDLAIRDGNLQFRLTVQHEIGHAIGFAHGNKGCFHNITFSNGQPGSHSASVLDCTLGNETNNLMEGGAACDLNEFSADEELAAQIMYPNNLLTCLSIRYGKWNSRRGTSSIYAAFGDNLPGRVIFQGLNSNNSVIWQSGFSPINCNSREASYQKVGQSSLNAATIRIIASNQDGEFETITEF